jgi:hypothetical protein
MYVTDNSLVSELFNVVQKTPSSLLPTSALPKKTRGINQVSKQDWCRYIPKQTKYHKLHPQCKGSLFFSYWPEKVRNETRSVSCSYGWMDDTQNYFPPISHSFEVSQWEVTYIISTSLYWAAQYICSRMMMPEQEYKSMHIFQIHFLLYSYMIRTGLWVYLDDGGDDFLCSAYFIALNVNLFQIKIIDLKVIMLQKSHSTVRNYFLFHLVEYSP